MQSFRSEIENPIVEKDIIDLEKKIHLFYEDKIDELANNLNSYRKTIKGDFSNKVTELNKLTKKLL